MPDVTTTSRERPIVSVIIVTWRLGSSIRETLVSIADSVRPPAFEIIVVSNGAGDASRAAIADSSVDVVVDLEVNTGYGYACNAGAAAASPDAEYLLFFNDDAIAAPDMIRNLVESAERSLDGRRVGAVAAVLLNEDGTIQEAGSRVLGDAGTVQFGAGATIADAEAQGLLRRREIDYGSGAALLIRRDAFTRLGGYDPRYTPAYFEDVDLAFRLRSDGCPTILEPTARAVHRAGASTQTEPRFREFAASRSGTAFTARWAQTLADAPTATDPVDDLCPAPALAEDDDVVAVPDGRAPMVVARTIMQDYASWLNRRLDDCEATADSMRTALDATREEARLATERAAEIGRRAAELSERLNELEHRGIVGIARWRVGAMMRHRAARGK